MISRSWTQVVRRRLPTEDAGDVSFVTADPGAIVAKVLAGNTFDLDLVLFGGSSPTELSWSRDPLTETAELTSLFYENAILKHENVSLSLQIEELKQRMESLERSVLAAEPTVVVLRELTRDEAKTEIIDLFSDGETYDYEDIVKRRGIELELAVELCDELMEEGEIGPVGDT